MFEFEFSARWNQGVFILFLPTSNPFNKLCVSERRCGMASPLRKSGLAGHQASRRSLPNKAAKSSLHTTSHTLRGERKARSERSLIWKIRHSRWLATPTTNGAKCANVWSGTYSTFPFLAAKWWRMVGRKVRLGILPPQMLYTSLRKSWKGARQFYSTPCVSKSMTIFGHAGCHSLERNAT